MTDTPESASPEAVQETAAPETAPVETRPEPPKWLPKGFEDAQLTDEQKGRVRRMHAQTESQKSALKVAARDNAQLLKRIEELEAKFATNEVVDIKKQRKAAIDDGDYDKAFELTETLVDKKRPKEQVPEPEAPTVPQDSGIDELPKEIQESILEWATETNGDDLVRPWAIEGHPDNKVAVALAQSIFNDPDWYGRSVSELLAEIDDRVTKYQSGTGKIKAVKKTAPVLTQSATPPAKTRQLSAAEALVAKKMFPNDADPGARYINGLKKVGKW